MLITIPRCECARGYCICVGCTDEGGNNVVLKTMSVSVEGRDDITLDLTGTFCSYSACM